MNGIFFTQASSLNMFYHIMQIMKINMNLDKVGFYLADSPYFNQFKQDYPEIESDFYLLKEWDIIADARGVKPNFAFLERYEKEIGQPYLWNALVADRRIYFGKKYAYAKDYRPRFNHEQMLSILESGLKKFERFIDEVDPDFIVSFQCVTIGEYLSYLFAAARNIPVLNLRPMRIGNYFYAGETILEPSDNLKKAYEFFLNNGIEPSLKLEANNYLQKVRYSHAMYEGVVKPSTKPPRPAGSGKKQNVFSLTESVLRLLKNEFKYRFGEYKYDNHVSGFVGPLFAKKIKRPIQAKKVNRFFKKLYVRSEHLSSLNYAFFPLHTEPEITLSVYSKSYLNQIEAVRLLSHNLSVGVKLVVKEHPWEIGKRSLNYYRKLADIPNVLLAGPELTSRELVLRARIITVIAGSIGLEALMLKKPVVALGRAPFNFMPTSMIRHVENPALIGFETRDLLENYQYDEHAMLSYIAAVIKNSVPVDYYSILLGRAGAYREGPGLNEDSFKIERKNQINRLAEYLIQRYNMSI